MKEQFWLSFQGGTVLFWICKTVVHTGKALSSCREVCWQFRTFCTTLQASPEKRSFFTDTPCQRNQCTILGFYEVWHPVFQGKHRDPMFFEGKTSNTYPDQVERCLTERRSWCKYSDPHPSRVEGYFPLLSKKVCSVNVTVFTIIAIIVKIWIRTHAVWKSVAHARCYDYRPAERPTID